MPFSNLHIPNVALGLMKTALQDKGIGAEIFNFHLLFAKRIGLETYRRLSSSFDIQPAWLFSAPLFGSTNVDSLLRRGWKNTEVRKYLLSLNCRPGESEWASLKQLLREDVPQFMTECLRAVDWKKYDVAAFSCALPYTVPSLVLAKKIKEISRRTRIVLGGPDTYNEMGHALLRGAPWIDFVVNGEGEVAFPLIVANILARRPNTPVPGVSCRRGKKIFLSPLAPPVDIEQSPAPDYSELFHEKNASPVLKNVETALPYAATRGCARANARPCLFCGYRCTDIRKFRLQPPEHVKNALMLLSKRYRGLAFYFADSALPSKYYDELFPLLRQTGVDFTFYGFAHPDIPRKHVRCLKAAGFNSIDFGIENLHSDLLKNLGKGFTALQAIRLLKWCREDDICVSWNFLCGLPGENAAHYEKNWKLLPHLTHLSPPKIFLPLRLYRDSVHFCRRQDYGFERVRPNPIYRAIYPEKKFILTDVAYAFSYVARWQLPDLEQRMTRLNNWRWEWQKAVWENETFLFYERGPGFIRFYDRRFRPGNPQEPPQPRIIQRPLLHKNIYLLCADNLPSVDDLLAQLKKADGAAPDRRAVEETLSDLTSLGLVYEEEGRYLGLALPAAAYPDSVRRGTSWERLNFHWKEERPDDALLTERAPGERGASRSL